MCLSLAAKIGFPETETSSSGDWFESVASHDAATAHCSPCSAPATLAAMRHELFAYAICPSDFARRLNKKRNDSSALS
jgi:hypothetical protein